MNYFLVCNPTARSGRGRRAWGRMFHRLREHGAEFNYRISERPREAVAITRRAVEAGYGTVVAVGGDGTICEVVTGIMKAREAGLPAVRFGVVYTGTSPDFNAYHALPLDPRQAVDTVLRGRPRPIDVGRVTYCLRDLAASFAGLESRTIGDLVHDDVITDFFVGNVNLGLGPMVARKANTGYRRALGDFLGTMSAVVGSFATYRQTDFKLRIDGREQVYERLINLTVGKNPYIASGMKVFSDIHPDDGRLAVLAVRCFSLPVLLANLPRLYRGTFLEHLNVTASFAGSVDILYDREHPEVEFDGDPKGFLPARVDVIPRGLEVMMPDG